MGSNLLLPYVLRYSKDGETLERIGREFNINKYSSAGSVIDRMKMQIPWNKKLRKRVEELENKLRMSQEKT